ncbi:AAA family ATPase [Clostridium sp. 'White wine YQ']|uniref:AAA family ATPase n=1 Tax=Clostridium sp. 'White wine YQ' TaxID=3027474 RepID=UPI0023673563|nr:AAA family ATPase [Clostridium sp. 'White wine YQ']MDD7796033.1 AAA family ATPase [Clostridium sp. 'White wine YQ']
MRPLKLTISAFGPYASKEVIDFNVLEGRNIFLITGPTGAGKTTIFDAISYALYGEASGTSRTIDNLRSDFANEEDITYVELEFSLRGKNYYVKRVPVQPKKRTTSAELIYPDGSIVTGATNVTKEVIELIRIDKNQFRQIVMLPQGEFRKLLESESKEREKIFREIFGTEEFNRIQFLLNIKKKELEEELKAINERRATNLRNINPGEDTFLMEKIKEKELNVTEVLGLLDTLLDKDRAGLETVSQNKNTINEKLDNLREKYIKAQEGNLKLQEKENLIKEKEVLQNQKEEIVNTEKKITLAKKALEVSFIEKSRNQKKEKLSKLREELILNANRVKDGEIELTNAVKTLEIEEKKEDNKKVLQEKAANLNSIKEKIVAYGEKKKELQSLNINLVKEKEENEALKKKIDLNNAEILKIDEELKETLKAETLKERLESKYREINNSLKEVRELYSAEDKVTKLLEDHNKLAKEYSKVEEEYKKSKTKYEMLDEAFKKGQAGLLASVLIEGDPCPVCGSTEHPKKAIIHEGVPSEKELKESKESLEIINNRLKEKLNETTRVFTSIKEQRENIEGKKLNLKSLFKEEMWNLEGTEALKEIAVIGKELAKDAKNLEDNLKEIKLKISNREKLEKDQKILSEEVEKLKKQQEERESIILNLFGRIQGEEKLVKSFEEEIPEELRSLESLNKSINGLNIQIDNIDKEIKIAREKVTSLKANLSAAHEALVLKQKEIEDTEKELKEVIKEFEDTLKKNSFLSEEEYRECFIAEEVINSLEEKVKVYYQDLKSLSDRLNKSIEECKDLKLEDLEVLNEIIEKEKKVQEDIFNNEKELYTRISNNEAILERVKVINLQCEKEESKYNIVGEIARVANGDNSQRITFERYVLAAYFDDIIKAANLRLTKMTGDRYLLKRKEEKGKGRKQEGLELEVFDNYTGKARHVKTLSGGESFKASLSLALGLADVVQSYAGGVTVDTMFVDEGFGTLDPESLDNAINCLIELQHNGRLVGIISHVPELKERIDARLEITPAKEGSKAGFKI